jgi:hypothetical protein
LKGVIERENLGAFLPKRTCVNEGSGMDHTRAFTLVERTPALPSPEVVRHDNQVVAA